MCDESSDSEDDSESEYESAYLKSLSKKHKPTSLKKCKPKSNIKNDARQKVLTKRKNDNTILEIETDDIVMLET